MRQIGTPRTLPWNRHSSVRYSPHHCSRPVPFVSSSSSLSERSKLTSLSPYFAINSRHLSWYERVVLKRNRYYDPVQDKVDRIDELRVLYESHLIAREDVSGASYEDDHAYITDDVVSYFRNETPDKQRVQRQITKERALHGDSSNEKSAIHRSRLEESLGGRA